jgi:hypothetical protein
MSVCFLPSVLDVRNQSYCNYNYIKHERILQTIFPPDAASEKTLAGIMLQR